MFEALIYRVIFWTKDTGLVHLVIVELWLIALVIKPCALFNPNLGEVFKLSFIELSKEGSLNWVDELCFSEEIFE